MTLGGQVRGRLTTRATAASSWLWNNALFVHARRLHSMPIRQVGIAAAAFGLICVVATIMAWVLNCRLGAAGLAGISFIGVSLPVLLIVFASVQHVAAQMRDGKLLTTAMRDLPPDAVITGLALAAMWRIRWLLVVSLALMPTFIVSLLRLEIAGYSTWQASAEMLGVATAAGQASRLLPDGRIPYLRLIIRAISGGFLAWAILPLLAVMGVAIVLALREPSLSALVALLSQLGLGGLAFAIWSNLARTPVFGGGLEILRVVLIAVLLGGLVILARQLALWSMRFLLDTTSEVDRTL
jgi:hypothetical protein